MKKMLGDLLHTEVKELVFGEKEKLPLYLAAGYEIKMFRLFETEVLFLRPKEQLSLAVLKKHWAAFTALSGRPCVICGCALSRYGRRRMIELGIPFLWDRDNMYLPFLGLSLGKTAAAPLPAVKKFSPMTQKTVLTALYEKWSKVSTKEIAAKLKVARITAARTLRELQALGLPLVEQEGKTKYFSYRGESRRLFELCRPYFSDPVEKSLPLREVPREVKYKSGLSALAARSLLAEEACPTFAVSKREYKALALDRYPSPEEDEPSCVVQVMNYSLKEGESVDPISALLSLSDAEKKDPRVEKAAEKILEEILDDKGPGKIQTPLRTV